MAAAVGGHELVSSHAIEPPGSCAVQIRLTPALKKQLLEAHEGGKACALRLADGTGSGACLSIGDQTVYLTSSTPTGAERTELVHRAPGAHSGSSTVARVDCKLVPQRGGAAAGKGGSLASKARQLEDKLEHQQPGGGRSAAAVRPSNPQPSGRTTAPQRTSLMIRKKASPPAEQQVPHLPPQQPPQDRNAPHGEPLTQEQVHTAFRESFRMGLSALLATTNLSCPVLVQKSVDAFQSHHLRTSNGAAPDKKEVMKEVKKIAQFRGPGVYVLMEPARKELEDFLKKGSSAKAAGGGGAGGKKPLQQQVRELSPPKPKAAQKARDRDWTSELTNGTTPPPEAPAAKLSKRKAPGGDPEAAAAKATKTAKKAKAAAERAAAEPPQQQTGGEQQPKDSTHRHSNSLESTETRHSSGSDADPSKAAKRSAGKKGHRNGDEVDCSWFREYASRKPKTAPGPIRTPQELEESSAEYKLKYKIYHRLHLEIQGAKDRATSLQEAELRQMWSSRKHQLLQMQAAFQCLHEELSSLKRAARDFVESYTRGR